ncbi:carboxypeptidase-like regulatory domain-containing protein [Carboxylicivirga sp. N1Y90]|uniref:carboxypeptidase-like regulatory domain-containing protein n=1 Tax=Carboxylicivirga fragile TaxID=3417571 RepID=UPI003D328E46|nr:carboxypeptidase-like regulatory domain-containing protein [Marinilabiliaceae bacterium N1Y90]
MNKKRSHIKANNLETFFRYIKGKMSSKDSNAFERNLLNDAFESDAMEGFEQYDEKKINQDLSLLKQKLNSHTKRKYNLINRNTIAFAATLLLVAGIVSVLVLFTPDKTTYVSDNAIPAAKEEIAPESLELESVEKKNFTAPKAKTPAINNASIENVSEEEIELEILDAEEEILIAVPQVKSKQAKLSSPPVNSVTTLTSRRKKAETSNGDKEIVGTMRGATAYGGYAGANESLRTIEGKVRNDFQEPVAGASINVKGTNYSTISNTDGAYKLSYPSRDSSKPVTASFVGYITSEKNSSSSDSVIFNLEEEYISLSEVITIKTDEEAIKKAEEYIPAEPIVGMDKYIEELSDNLIYPKNGSGKKETVVVSVIISPLGYIKDIIIKRSPGEIYSMEAIRVIQESSGWKPATNLGLPIQDAVKVRLRFIPPEK